MHVHTRVHIHCTPYTAHMNRAHAGTKPTFVGEGHGVLEHGALALAVLAPQRRVEARALFFGGVREREEMCIYVGVCMRECMCVKGCVYPYTHIHIHTPNYAKATF